MSRLPTPGGDDGTWGDILNDFLGVEHNSNGTQKPLSVSKLTSGSDGQVVTSNSGSVAWADLPETGPDYDLLANAPGSGTDKALFVATDQGLRQWESGSLTAVGPQETDISNLQTQINDFGAPITPTPAWAALMVNSSASAFMLQQNVPTVTRAAEASLPAANSVPPGSVFVATDTTTVFETDGSGWFPVAWTNAQGRLGGAYSNLDISQITLSNLALAGSGTEQLVGVYLPKGAVISTLEFRTGNTAATFGTNNDGHWYIVVRKQDGSLMASTADQGTGAIGSNSNLSKAIGRDSGNSAASSWTVPTSDVYLVGPGIYLGTGGSPVMPILYGAAALNNAALNNIRKTVSATVASQTTGIPATAPGTPSTATIQPVVWAF